MYWLLLLSALIAASFGQVFYKLYSNTSKLYYLPLTILCFVSAPLFSYLTMKKLSVDLVYMATSLNSFIILSLSALVLKEHVNKKQIFASLIIFLGVVIYAVKL